MLARCVGCLYPHAWLVSDDIRGRCSARPAMLLLRVPTLEFLPCNWKAGAEAFIEAYHVRETHSTGNLGDEVTTQYDIFGENVSRFIHTRGLNSPLKDNPRTEDKDQIIDDILKGVPKLFKAYFILHDREAAIHKILSLAKSGDVVVIAGKGHEKYQIIHEKRGIDHNLIIMLSILNIKNVNSINFYEDAQDDGLT